MTKNKLYLYNSGRQQQLNYKSTNEHGFISVENSLDENILIEIVSGENSSDEIVSDEIVSVVNISIEIVNFRNSLVEIV